jgi:radical SAM protein with 4Fe4S-binding SPASM domain
VLRRLLSERVLENRGAPLADAVDTSEGRAVPWPTTPHLTAPEATHLALTYRCDAGCPDCYAARCRGKPSRELGTPEVRTLIDKIASWGVFQLAIGGGEPLLREDLEELTTHAAGRGLSVHVTTSGDGLSAARIRRLAGVVTCLQIGVRHERLLAEDPEGVARQLRRVREEEAREGLTIGANLVLCHTVVHRFNEAIRTLFDLGYRRITLLRYKPPASLARWREEAPRGDDLKGMEGRIERAVARHPGLEIRLDCALAFLQRAVSPGKARSAGLRGCVAGARIVAIGADGTVYPCSQLVDSRYAAGNLLRDDPGEIWSKSAALARLRGFRSSRPFRRSACGACRAAEHCGGCRALAHDALGPDHGCPGPILETSERKNYSTGPGRSLPAGAK